MKRLLFICCLASVIAAQAQPKPATVRTYDREFKTYPFSDPDPLVKFGHIYPYYRFDGYAATGVNKSWKAVELENDFIRLMILPEVGGKIWGAWEKATGKPFLYFNQVVKFRDVAMRGPWTSGGIEANYGIIGHTPNCATPVDYFTRTNDDGSVSCFIGTLDLLTETYWTLEINLPSDKAYFTTRSHWYNGSSAEQPYYTWMNTGIPAAGDLEFVYPGNRYLGHGGEYADWKINPANGKNISFYEQNNFGSYKSYHVFGTYTDFFGAFWHQHNVGMGRFAYRSEKPGKKIWIWGLSQQGMIWDKLLTDTDGQYVEVQSGRLFNQSAEASTFTPFKHRGFAPGVTDTWTEYWFPVVGMKGFVHANPHAALNLQTGRGWLRVSLSPLQATTAPLKVRDGSKLIYERSVTLTPLKKFEDSVRWDGDIRSLTVQLGDHLLDYKADPAADTLSRPMQTPADFDWTTVYGLYLQGKENLRQRFYVQAEEKLRACLAKDANYLPALTDLAMLMYRNLRDQEALALAKRALAIDTYDGGANYYYGLIQSRLGRDTDARDGFDMATASAEFRSAAFTELARINLRRGEIVRALHDATEALKSNVDNTDALLLKAVAYRRSGEQTLATQTLQRLEEVNPLHHALRFERWRWQPTTANKQAFSGMIRNEMPQETYLTLADWYLAVGANDDAMEILNTAPAHPEVHYWRAWLRDQQQKGSGRSEWEAGNNLSPDLVFPFRARSATVLQWVATQTDRWEPRYYLALIHGSRNNRTAALQWLREAGTPAYSGFYAALAALDPSQALSHLRKGESLNPNQWRFGKLISERLMAEGKAKEALQTSTAYRTRFPNDFRLAMIHAKALLLNEQYAACARLLLYSQ